MLAERLAANAEMPFEEYLRKAVLDPLHMEAVHRGTPAGGLHGTLDDLVKVTNELMTPTLVAPETLAEATRVQFPGLAGVIPGLGRFDPNDWGLSFELKDGKQPHFTGTLTSPRTYGHWGASGTLFWVDPDAGLALGAPHRPRLRRLGEGGLARVQRRDGRRGTTLSCAFIPTHRVVGHRALEHVEPRLEAERGGLPCPGQRAGHGHDLRRADLPDRQVVLVLAEVGELDPDRAGRDPDPRQPVVELDRDDLHPAERRGGLRGERACRRNEHEQEHEALHRRSGTRPNDFACGMTAAASVDSHCSSTEL